MAEETSYDYGRSHGELMGSEAPMRTDWDAGQHVRQEHEQADQMTEINIQDEQLNEGASKIEEITNMLSMTMRLTKFKKACGSLTTILKIRPEGEGEAAEEVGKEGEPVAGTATGDATTTSGGMATDLQGKMTDQLGKIGALFRKSDGA